MGIRLGLNCNVYRNTGSYASPTWNEVQAIKDLALNLEKAEADVSTRSNGGWRATLATLKDASIDFQMIADRSVTTEKADLDAFRTAFFTNAVIELIVLDGPEPAPSGSVASEGLRASFSVMSFTRNENLEEGVTYDISIKPGPSENAPEWFTGTVSA